ncbi:MAG: hypothetical protein GXY67_03050 [Clostridiales bacterium]|nr:hypothetical protein [Clostridiales bacterium]
MLGRGPSPRREQGNGSAHPQPRSAPQGMPRDVVNQSRVPKQTEKPRDVLPPQEALTNEEAVKPGPKRWVVILRRVMIGLLGTLALALVYIFLLLGEPDSMAVESVSVPADPIRVPMAAMEAPGEADLSALAASFGKPILALYGGLNLQKCSLYDTAFQGAYARRTTLHYTFDDGQTLLVESIRPAQAVALLEGASQARLSLSNIYALAGVDAVRMDNAQNTIIFGEKEGVVYAVNCPTSHRDDLAALLKQTTLLQPKAPGT